MLDIYLRISHIPELRFFNLGVNHKIIQFMNKLFCFALFAMIMGPVTSFAQNSDDKHKEDHHTHRLETKVNRFFEFDEFNFAIPTLEELISLHPENGKYEYQMGIALYYSNLKYDAYEHFKRGEKLGHKTDRQDFYRGRTEHLQHNFDAALHYYEKHLQFLSTQEELDVEEIEEVTAYISQCSYGILFKEENLDVKIENMGSHINTEYPEYVPAINENEDILIFTSRRPDTKGGKKDSKTGEMYEDIYISYKKNGVWTDAVGISDNINTKLHDVNVGMSHDASTLYTYKGRMSHGHLVGDLYQSSSSIVSGKLEWTVPERMPAPIHSNYHELSASITPDKKVFFFSSNRPGGLGGEDIYYSIVDENGNYGKPVNLGPQINTPYDEDSPAIHADGKTLFFSSQGHNSIGGFDVFSSEFDSIKGEWTPASNLGFPVNTADDDLHFVWSADGRSGYFSSSRLGTKGKKDIFRMEIPEHHHHIILVKGIVKDSLTDKALKANVVVTEWESKKLIGTYETDGENGKFICKLKEGQAYELAFEVEGYIYNKEKMTIPTRTVYFEVNETFKLKPYDKPEQVATDTVPEGIANAEPGAGISDNPSLNRSDILVKLNKIEQGTASERFEKNKPVESSHSTDKKITNSDIDKVLAPGDKIVFRNIHFEFDKYHITNNSYESLDKVAIFIKKHPQLVIEISGHTDNVGSKNYNLKLSEKRANSIFKYLVDKKGIKPGQLSKTGYGDRQPVASNESPEGRKLNRRTEFKILETTTARK